MPEIPLFRTVRHSGHAVLETLSDQRRQRHVDREGSKSDGHSEYNDYSILILLHFTNTDLETNGIGEAFSRNTFGAEKHLVWLIISMIGQLRYSIPASQSMAIFES